VGAFRFPTSNSFPLPSCTPVSSLFWLRSHNRLGLSLVPCSYFPSTALIGFQLGSLYWPMIHRIDGGGKEAVNNKT